MYTHLQMSERRNIKVYVLEGMREEKRITNLKFKILDGSWHTEGRQTDKMKLNFLIRD